MAWHTYRNLEKDFIDVTRYVALEKKNRGVWSEKITQLLLLTGSIVDSVFNQMRQSHLLPQNKDLSRLRAKDKPTVEHYREVYEDIYQLSTVELTVHHGLTYFGSIRPFDAFGREKTPPWWNAYNSVKHGFFQHMRKGKLDHLVHALGGLFALNVLHKDSQQYLLKIGALQMGDFDKRFVYWRDPKRGWDAVKNSFLGLHGDVAWDAWVTSEIFLHRFRRDPSAKS